MFRGISPLNLDAKGRLAVPARHRETLMQTCNGRVVITVDHSQRCLTLYPLDTWEAVERELTDLPSLNPVSQQLKRLLMGYATDCEIDGGGRILLPAALRDYAALTKQVVLIGQGNKFEIWSEELWQRHTEQTLSQPLDTSALTEKLESLVL